MIKCEFQNTPPKAGSAYGMFSCRVKLNYIITTQGATELIEFPFKLKTNMRIRSRPYPLKLLYSLAQLCP